MKKVGDWSEVDCTLPKRFGVICKFEIESVNEIKVFIILSLDLTFFWICICRVLLTNDVIRVDKCYNVRYHVCRWNLWERSQSWWVLEFMWVHSTKAPVIFPKGEGGKGVKLIQSHKRLMTKMLNSCKCFIIFSLFQLQGRSKKNKFSKSYLYTFGFDEKPIKT
jgi:hypothetical protein